MGSAPFEVEVDKGTVMRLMCEFHTIKLHSVNFTGPRLAGFHTLILTGVNDAGRGAEQSLSRGETACVAQNVSHHARGPLGAVRAARSEVGAVGVVSQH